MNHIVVVEAELFKLNEGVIAVKDTHNYFLAAHCWEGTYAQVYVPVVNQGEDTSILRPAFFCNVHSAHDLDTRNDCRVKSDRVLEVNVELAVNSVTYSAHLFVCFDVNI